MHMIFSIGDEITYETVVKAEDVASFNSGIVHEVYSTFALGRDAEWACRQFVLQMKESHEEGIGTFLTIVHESPALVGSTVSFVAKLDEINDHEIICSWVVHSNNRRIAHGKTGQKILKKERIEALFSQLK